MVTLDVLLKGCLIIPYEEEIIAALSEVCKSYSNEHHSDDDVAGLAIAVFSKGPLDDLKNKIEKIYNEKVEKKIKLPKCTMRAIATYIIELMIEEVDDESSAINILALMNCMIILNKYNRENETYNFLKRNVQFSLFFHPIKAKAFNHHSSGN